MATEMIDRVVNPVIPDANTSNALSSDDIAFLKSLFIADLHADTLLWERDLTRRADYGHLDLPRMADGGISFQVFTVVTRTPMERGGCVHAEDGDFAGLLTIIEQRPIKTWFDLEARAIYQATRLRAFAAESTRRSRVDPAIPSLHLIESFQDLAKFVEARKAGDYVIGAVLGLEGAHWVGQGNATATDVEADVARLHTVGFRMLAPTHRFDNGLAGSSEGCTALAEKQSCSLGIDEPSCHAGGLTENGVAFVNAVRSGGIALDVSHSSSAAISDAVRIASMPVIVSHTGVTHNCEPPCNPRRNMTDEDIWAVARTGGIIGIGYWPEAVGPSTRDIVATLVHVYRVLDTPTFRHEMGPDFDPADHIALGSDFDGAVQTPFDAAGVGQLITALRNYPDATNRFFSDADVRKIAGRNVCRIFGARLPGGSLQAGAQLCVGV
jgi:microsomal dipeptidase-like Zn-dependent dipeptidase